MNSSSGALPAPAIHGKESRPGDRRVIVFAIILALAVIAGLLLWQVYNREQPAAVTLAGEQRLAENPELKSFYRLPVRTEASILETLLARDAFLAQNPELKVQAQPTTLRDGDAFLAQNPELSAARRYTALATGK
jgi:hypothetical protein